MADVEELRRTVAMACRVMGVEFPGAGHVSARIPGTDEMWLMCRGGAGRGLTGANLSNIRRLDFEGGPGGGPGLGNKYWPPHETPLHGEIYKARPDVGAVVHVHPRHAVLCSVIDVEFTPILGGYNPGLASIAILGIPVYERTATVVDQEMAVDMVKAMGSRDIVLLKGHGIAATGKTVEAATSVAQRFEQLCEFMWQVALSGRKPTEMSQLDKDRYDPRNPNRSASIAMLQRYGDRIPANEFEDGERGGPRVWTRKLETTVGLPDEHLDDDG